jgi:6-phosphogluconolactonase (cycloisomerase 2 family)
VGSGLTLQVYQRTKRLPHAISNPLQINANGAFSIGNVVPVSFFADIFPVNALTMFVEVTHQPLSPAQKCLVRDGTFGIQTKNVTNVDVVCAEYAYVTNAGDDSLSAYTIDATTGALLAIDTPIATGTSPFAIVATQDKRYVYVGNEGSNDISAFAVDAATGTLTAVPGSPFASGTHPRAMALYQYDSYLAVASAGSDILSAYAVNASTGALTPLSPATYATGKGPSSIAVDPNGHFIFVANNGGSNDISAFLIDWATGRLTAVAGSPYPAGANPLSLAFWAGLNYGGWRNCLYAANPDGANSSISGFAIDDSSGALSPLSSSPFSVSMSNHIAMDRTGAFLYATTGANVVGYGIDAATCAFTALPGFPVGAGANASSATIDPTNQFLYVANDGEANISGFRLDASTGALTLMPGSPFPAGNHPRLLATF